jgi:uncharacterized protein YggE
MTLSTRSTALCAVATVAICATIAVVAAGALPVAAADGDDDPMLRTISVAGHGEEKGTPDQAHLSAGVVTEGKTAAEALAANARAMNQVFATLKRAGIPDKHIQTSNFNISPQYADDDGRPPHTPRIIGYQVTNTVQVTVDGVARTGPVLDGLVSSGANQSHGIFFTIADPKPLEERARREAVEEAIAKARTIADASGVRLGRVISVNEGGGYMPPLPMVRGRIEMAQDASTPVAAGEATVLVNVSVVFEIL